MANGRGAGGHWNGVSLLILANIDIKRTRRCSPLRGISAEAFFFQPSVQIRAFYTMLAQIVVNFGDQ